MTDQASNHDLALAEEFAAATADLRLGRPLHTYGSLGSTNEVAMLLAESGAPEGTLVIPRGSCGAKGGRGAPGIRRGARASG